MFFRFPVSRSDTVLPRCSFPQKVNPKCGLYVPRWWWTNLISSNCPNPMLAKIKKLLTPSLCLKILFYNGWTWCKRLSLLSMLTYQDILDKSMLLVRWGNAHILLIAVQSNQYIIASLHKSAFNWEMVWITISSLLACAHSEWLARNGLDCYVCRKEWV